MKKQEILYNEDDQEYSEDNPYNGSDDEEGADFYESYMEGFEQDD